MIRPFATIMRKTILHGNTTELLGITTFTKISSPYGSSPSSFILFFNSGRYCSSTRDSNATASEVGAKNILAGQRSDESGPTAVQKNNRIEGSFASKLVEMRPNTNTKLTEMSALRQNLSRAMEESGAFDVRRCCEGLFETLDFLTSCDHAETRRIIVSGLTREIVSLTREIIGATSALDVQKKFIEHLEERLTWYKGVIDSRSVFESVERQFVKPFADEALKTKNIKLDKRRDKLAYFLKNSEKDFTLTGSDAGDDAKNTSSWEQSVVEQENVDKRF